MALNSPGNLRHRRRPPPRPRHPVLLPDHPDGMCAYETTDGKQCAAGKLIPDNLYNRNMEELPIDKVFARFPKVAEHIGPENLKLVDRLQGLHDNDEPADWSTYLFFVSEGFNLNPKVLTR
jgi:hypothetical protein